MKQIKKYLGFIAIFILLISSTFGESANIEDLKVDNTNYEVKRDVWSYLFSFPFSAYTDGSIISAPDKQKQVELHSKLTSLYYPMLNREVVMEYEFIAPEFEECEKQDQYYGPVPEGYDVEKFRCEGVTEKLDSLGTEKRYISESGKDEEGNSKIDISEYVEQGATHVKVDYHYVREDAKESTSFTKEEEEAYEELNDEDKLSHEDIDEDDNDYQDKVPEEDTSSDEPETKYLEQYFCDGDNVMQKIIENEEESKRLFKECDECVSLEDGAQCITGDHKQNQTNNESDTGEPQEQNYNSNDDVEFPESFYITLAGLGIGGTYLYRKNKKTKGGKKRK